MAINPPFPRLDVAIGPPKYFCRLVIVPVLSTIFRVDDRSKSAVFVPLLLCGLIFIAM